MNMPKPAPQATWSVGAPGWNGVSTMRERSQQVGAHQTVSKEADVEGPAWAVGRARYRASPQRVAQ